MQRRLASAYLQYISFTTFRLNIKIDPLLKFRLGKKISRLTIGKANRTV